MTVSTIVDVVLAAVLIVAAGVWIGGYAAVIVVSVISAKTLDGPARVRFFRMLGSAYLKFTGPALLVAYAVGWSFLTRLTWTGGSTRLAVGSALLLIVLAAGVAQARNMTRLRRRAFAEPANDALGQAIRRRARAATILRALIGILSLWLVIEVAIRLTDVL